LRVFLRHYSVHLAGADPADGLPEYRADARAARGFNGDIARHLERWTSALEGDADVSRLGTRIARRTLLAVAGLVSLRDATWSTDRRACATRWNELEPGIPVDALVAWLDTPPRDRDAIHTVLQGPVAAVVIRMATYNTESSLARLLAGHYRRAHHEARSLLHEAFATPADIRLVNGRMHITLNTMSAPHRTRAIAELCRDLTDTQTLYPATNHRLVYAIKNPDGSA
jgi:hypothetical protein